MPIHKWNQRKYRPITRKRRVFRAFSSLAVLGVAAFFFWPMSMGGKTTLIVVRGTSMDPTFHTNDMVYVRAGVTPRVGDVAAYNMPIGDGKTMTVIHRIVEQTKSGQFIFRGDNRETNDAYPIDANDIIGIQQFNFGQLPTRLLAATPLYGTLLTGAIVIWMLWPSRRVQLTQPAISPSEDSAG